MTWTRSTLIVANLTAASDELYAALQARAQAEACRFTLIIPSGPGEERAHAEAKLAEAMSRLTGAGLEVQGKVVDCDPLVAVTEAWNPKIHDDIIVCTLPMRLSKWLHAGLPERVGRLTGAPVTHVVAQPPAPALRHDPAPEHEDRGPLLGPLSVLGWGAKPEGRVPAHPEDR